MKKNYTNSVQESPISSASCRLWRFFAFSLLCFLLCPALSFHANAQGGTLADDEAIIWLATPGSGPILDCYIKEVTITSRVHRDGVNLNEGATFQWTGPDGFSSETKDIIVSKPGIYKITAKTANGLTGVNSIEILGENYPKKFAGPDLNVHPSTKTVRLQGYSHGYYDILWEASNGGNIVSGENTLNPVVDAPGTYTINLTERLSGCTMQDSMVVTEAEDVLSAIIVSGSIPELDCYGNPVLLGSYVTINGYEVKEGLIYSWTGPNDFASETRGVSVEEPGNYTLEVKHIATGLTSTATVGVTQLRFPEGSAGPDKKLTCDNPTVTLEGSMTNDFGHPIWLASDGGNFVSGYRTLNPVVDAPGTYTLILQHPKGCTVEYTVKVTRDEGPSVSATGGSLDCTTGSVQLTGSSDIEGVTYSWTGPNGYTSTEQNPTVKVAGDYKLTVTNPETKCTASTSVVVTPVSEELQVTKHMLDFNSEKRGLIKSINTEAGPVAIMGRKRNADGSYAQENHAAIFDTQDPTGDDTNLYTEDWGNALIINQKLNDYPDATRWGGELILDFSAIGPVTMESLNVVGMDTYEQKSWVYLYDAEGNELHKEYIKPLGQNSKQIVNLGNTRGVMMMKVMLDGTNSMWEYSGSAAIDDIKFQVETTVENPCEAVAASNITHSKAYPTSFSEQATIEFIVRETENYTINLYDTQGMLIKQLQSGTARAGELTRVEMDGRELKEGMYLARLVSESGSQTFKLILKR